MTLFSHGTSETALTATRIVSSLFHAAAESPDHPLEMLLTKALARAFPRCQVTASWRHGRGYRSSPPMNGPIALEAELLAEELATLNWGSAGEIDSFVLQTSVDVATGSYALRLLPRHQGPMPPSGVSEALCLWVVRTPFGSSSRLVEQDFSDLRTNTRGLRLLFEVCSALRRIGELATLAHRVAMVTTVAGQPLVELVAKSQELLKELEKLTLAGPRVEHEARTLARDLAKTVLLETLGRGWDIHNFEGGVGIDRVVSFSEALGRLDGSGGIAGEIQAIRATLDAVASDAEESNEKTTGESWPERNLWLLSKLTVLHQQARHALAESGRGEAREIAHLARLKEKCLQIGGILRHFGPGRSGEIRTQFLSAWIRLWFCHHLLTRLDDGTIRAQIAENVRWRFYADLAYVSRESLRALLFADHPHFFFQPVVFSAALRTLVEVHALTVVGLPKEPDLKGMLELIARVSPGGGPHFATGHLQHVLEAYLVGHFLCELRLEIESVAGLEVGASDEKGVTKLVDVLAGRAFEPAGELRKSQFLKSFSLACIFHDVGMLLFPYWSRTTERLGEIDNEVAGQLREIRIGLNAAAKEFMEQVQGDLLSAGYCHEKDDQRLVSWLKDVCAAGDRDHCVLGAWYLHRICQQVEDLSPDIVLRAVRAVLLHRAVLQEIDAEADPAAALLLICDMLIIWIEGHEPPQPDALGRYFQAIAGDLRPNESPYAALTFSGLSVAIEEGGELACTLKLVSESILPHPERTAERVWPKFEISLKDPDLLPLPVEQLWLEMSQNLGRLRPSRLNFGAALRLESKVPKRLGNLTTERLLEEVAERAPVSLRPALLSWLAAVKPRILAAKLPTTEVLEICPLPRTLKVDFERCRSEIRDLAREVAGSAGK